MCNVYATAQTLAQLDAAMREPHARTVAIAKRVRFYQQAVLLFAVRRLNSLGDLVPSSTLSERSLDQVFEDPRYSDAVVAHIVQLADRDPAFRAALIEQEGPIVLSQWRAHRAAPQLGLFASAA
ncbi:hypothetical protein [Dyella ginsengisoli]|uniref:hypothetical protein n=1 Tax=Dyella ginsengisoli TaxID=363848 RepID=UPI000345C5E3|nr:hypothetical protein [Dyella ginsengisoli]